jgi:hypothetical protein
MTVKTPTKPEQNAVKWSQIRRRIELCIREIILRFEMNSYKVLFFLESYSHIIQYFKASIEVLGYWWIKGIIGQRIIESSRSEDQFMF